MGYDSAQRRCVIVVLTDTQADPWRRARLVAWLPGPPKPTLQNGARRAAFRVGQVADGAGRDDGGGHLTAGLRGAIEEPRGLRQGLDQVHLSLSVPHRREAGGERSARGLDSTSSSSRRAGGRARTLRRARRLWTRIVELSERCAASKELARRERSFPLRQSSGGGRMPEARIEPLDTENRDADGAQRRAVGRPRAAAAGPYPYAAHTGHVRRAHRLVL
ncbi:hypothetical protein T492DRAFT_69695 [Pavlovales sp. CCMP2436]|nr:hypothetical protein T492DRAFT_69695 [Pavlovales sp. CCMP2436]